MNLNYHLEDAVTEMVNAMNPIYKNLRWDTMKLCGELNCQAAAIQDHLCIWHKWGKGEPCQPS